MLKRCCFLLLALGVAIYDLFVQLISTILFLKKKEQIIILYYHEILPSQKNNFTRQIKILSKFGRVVDAFSSGAIKGTAYAITFDDAFENIIENAIPVLKSKNIPFSIFVSTDHLGSLPVWLQNSNSQARNCRLISKEQLINLSQDQLVTIGSHGKSHKKLCNMTDLEAYKELSESKIGIEKLLKKQITMFSFPYGSFTRKQIEIACKVGYQRLFCVETEKIINNYEQFVFGRVNVDPGDWTLEFILKIKGAYRFKDFLRKKLKVKKYEE